ncbi:capsid cement protein [Micromonospora tulbaghiae]|uniref:capsid cement protein n=1 Tax=Micromonospora tulbaghiae TaxID=479978 RepID=UPI0033DCD6AB
MPDYAPLYMPGDVITGVTSAAVVGGRQLMVSGNGTVAHATADSNAVVGTAAHDAASGANVTYHGRGQVHVSTAAGAITAAARLNSAANGTVASATAGVGNIGIALTTAADGALVTWMEC